MKYKKKKKKKKKETIERFPLGPVFFSVYF